MSASIQHDARALTLARGGRWNGTYGIASCPVCQPEGRAGQDALTLTNGHIRLLLHCKKSGCVFRDILVALGIQPGTFIAPDPAISAKRAADQHAAAEKHAAFAKEIWHASLPIQGTVAEAYLRRRGITCALPQTLRFHPKCWHREAHRCFPAMVGRVDRAERFAVHRTYLRQDGSGKADVEQQRMMLGSVQGGAVRLMACDGPLVVAEGIENALSLACGLLDGPGTIWASLSTSGMRALRLPEVPGQLIVAADGDDAGNQAADQLANRAKAAGWCVELCRPPQGTDWNDVLRLKQST